ncbi:MAG TPA: hypothetical protein VM716_16465 [Gemmatimonadales bacterium]|nr:hypothetical protein [Gemmatimonadales bacterium]
MSRVTLGFAALRTVGVAALVLLLWNPSAAREAAGNARLVLLDASLSMAGHGGRWRQALDTARALARGSGIGGRGSGGVIWRFGDRVTAFDTLPPTEGASRLGPALAAAAGRGGDVVVVTDGAVADRSDLPPDLLRRARVVVLPRPAFFDAFVASVEGPRRVAAGDTIRLTVSYGVAGKRDASYGMRDATLSVSAEGRRLASRAVPLPDSGVVSTELTLPASRISHPGSTALTIALDGVSDSEPRDDARVFVLEVSPQASVVLLAAPPDWETRFLARTLQDVARVPVHTFVEVGTGSGSANRWRDAATLKERTPAVVASAVAGARLVIEAGDPAAFAPFQPKGAVLRWPDTRRLDGDWYVEPTPPASPLAASLAGIAWDSLPPLTSVADLPPPPPSTPDSTSSVGLTARLARRSASRPVIVLSVRDGRRRAAIAAGGLYRWAFRGGASGEAYRALVAGLVDWLLGAGTGSDQRFVPVTYGTPNGMPLVWRWVGTGTTQNVIVSLSAEGGRPLIDTLRFDESGRAQLRLAPGVYRYTATGGNERGVVAVDTYSDEWRPAAAALTDQPGAPEGRGVSVPLRDRWWLFALAIAAFTAEWAWRRRQGLP